MEHGLINLRVSFRELALLTCHLKSFNIIFGTVMRLDSAQHRYVKGSLPNEVIRLCRIPLVGVAESTSLYWELDLLVEYVYLHTLSTKARTLEPMDDS